MSVRTRPLPPYAAVDLLAVVVLAAITLAGFWDTFAGVRWIVVAAAGVAIGLVWTLVLTTLRLGIGVVVPLLPVPYLLTAGALALGSSGLFLGVPGIETITDVAVGTVGSWRLLVETAPPVDSRGTVLLIPYALGMLPAAIASVLALRSRRPVLPLLPLLVALVLALLLGVTDPFSTPLQGVGFGVVALAWVAHRGLRVEAGRAGDAPTAAVSGPRLLVGLGVVGLVAAASYSVVEVPADNRRDVLREVVQPYDSSYLTTPLSAFRRFRDQGSGVYTNLADRKLFRVRGAEPGTRVRVAVLDRYDGTRWYAADDASPDDFTDRFLRVSSRVDNPARGEERLYTVFVRNTWDLPWVPTIGALQAFDFYDDYASDRLPDLRYNRATDTALLPGGLHVNEDYVLTAVPTPDRLTVRMKPWRRPDATLQEAAAFLDVPARAWSLGARTPMAGVFRIADRLRARGRYSDGAFGWEARFEEGHDAQRLDEGFVNAPMMVGNDEQYAATMALLANRIGVPARVAVGAVLGRNGVIKGKHLDAWVEVRVGNGTWRVLPTRAFMGRRPPRRDSAPLPEVALPPAPRPQDRPPTQQPEPEEALEDESAREEATDRPLPRWPLLLLVPLAAGVVPLLKGLRRRRRRGATPASLAYLGGWDELVDTAHDLGVTVPRSPRPAQAVAIGVPTSLAREADVATFSPDEPDDADAFWRLVEEERSGLRSAARPVRRLLAPLDPRSLLRRR
ncbi:transglutaminase-like domain-containing protein [Nocardioides sediminis]|uniref:transglutaminase-like domain-containing protein n=1 Tax=Nocardioides sediminis TaxID=433648 RepID=UPI000D2FB3DA|nr:transglutaminase-like domain-containing protein [Nocardioides sediminis]